MGTDYYYKISAYYDKYACNYDSRYWENPVVQQIRQSFREEVKLYPANSMLEIGTGTGLDLVHFSKTHPHRKIYGIDISSEMINYCRERIQQSGCGNIEIRKASAEEINTIFPQQKFNLIYIFFGALNTAEDLQIAASELKNVLTPGGIMVLTFVNKWYLIGMLLDLVRLRFKRAFSRLHSTWSGYSSEFNIPSHCYTPNQIKVAFSGLKIIKRKGYSIIQPAWYFTGINKKLGKLNRILWSIDNVLNKTFLWRFGEYTLFVFKG